MLHWEEVKQIRNTFKRSESLGVIDLQKKKSISHFLYDLSAHWADIFVNPLPFDFVPFKTCPNKYKPFYIFNMSLYISFVHMMHGQNDYWFSEMMIKIQKIFALLKFGITRCFKTNQEPLSKVGQVKVENKSCCLEISIDNTR